jgi:hypothetical protein
MSKPVAFLVVGHRQWGKSRTIRALALKPGWVTIAGRRFFVRIMSNDDQKRSYSDFVAAVRPERRPFLVAAYCPEGGSQPLLRALARKYRVRAFVLERNYRNDDSVSPNEIARLRAHARVYVYAPVRRPAAARAKALARFIRATP